MARRQLRPQLASARSRRAVVPSPNPPAVLGDCVPVAVYLKPEYCLSTVQDSRREEG